MSKSIKDIIKNPALLFLTIGHREFFNWMDDKTYLKIAYRIKMGKQLNLDNPKTFSEKLQWLKLYNRKSEHTQLVDKYEVKQIVADIIGEEYIIPTLGVWEKFEDINFNELPNQFVLKCTHDSGGLVICKDKSKLDIERARKKIKRCLNHQYYWGVREWPYKNVKRRIIAEKYIDPKPLVKDLPDYKWYCFNGEPIFCQVIQDRSTDEKIDFFDTEWNHQPFIGLNPKAKHAVNMPNKPSKIETHIKIARQLSKDFPYARVDLYDVGEQIYFGEITLFPGSGFGSFTPDEWNEKLGDLINLPLPNSNNL